jgi:PTS system fructose-specific IIC component
MKITDLLAQDRVALRQSAKSREAVLERLTDLQMTAGTINDRGVYLNALFAREDKGTTAVGEGIAIPHAKSSAVTAPSLAVITLTEGVDCGSPDGIPSDLFFAIAAPMNGDLHLEILSRLMVLLMDEGLTARLRGAPGAKEFLAAIDEAEAARYPEETVNATQRDKPRVLVVTACPTGIAHTFMAAESLTKAGEKLGFSLKAETNGSGGAQNVLTREEIAGCDGIIIAADREVETARFNGKPVLFVKVADGIHKPEELIMQVIDGRAPVFESSENAAAEQKRDESFGRKLYKQLMNGVSHMLPFVVGGGILIALAFLLDDYSIDPANFGSNTPLAAFFKSIGDGAFSFMLPILAGYIACAIADRSALAAGIVGGYIASVGNSFWNISGTGAVSGGFLAALLAGFAAGYIVLGIKKATNEFPQSLQKICPVLVFPLLGILLVGVVMFLINPIMGIINEAMTNGLNSLGGTSKILLGIVLAGMMSIDMGGPFNKAAYVFGTMSIASGNYDVMAAVMIGGMIPPLAIALCTTFFKRKWTEDERKSGAANYIMGLCFITEGAIPFAASDPLRVLPSCIVGSGAAGALSMLFGCTLRAPHGGIFVFPVVGNVVGYLVSLAVGSVVGMFLLALLKKNRV